MFVVRCHILEVDLATQFSPYMIEAIRNTEQNCQKCVNTVSGKCQWRKNQITISAQFYVSMQPKANCTISVIFTGKWWSDAFFFHCTCIFLLLKETMKGIKNWLTQFTSLLLLIKYYECKVYATLKLQIIQHLSIQRGKRFKLFLKCWEQSLRK